MIKNSIAIVLKRFPYSETSLIARCFVKDLGKVSFIVHGAHRKKSPMGAYFQPANCLNLVYYFKENRDLQTISKASFNYSWSNIPKDLKKFSYAMAMIELTDKCLTDNDSHNNLFRELFSSLKGVEISNNQLNIIYWNYQYSLLTFLGFKPDFQQSELDFIPLPNPYEGPNSKDVFNYFEKGEQIIGKNFKITAKDRRVISNYLNACLGIHFDGVKNLKSLKILREILSN